MSQKSAIQTFFDENPTPKTWRADALQMRKNFGKLLTIANKVFEGPACALEVFDSLPARSGTPLPAIRLSYPNGAKLEFFDNLSLYAVSVTSPDKDTPDRFMESACRPDIDWSEQELYRPGIPDEMRYPPREKSPHQFTFKTNDHEPVALQKLVLQFSWLQKQAMGLTKVQHVEEAQFAVPAEADAKVKMEVSMPIPMQRQFVRQPEALTV